jgi:ketosteroid isomerase-like protein
MKKMILISVTCILFVGCTSTPKVNIMAEEEAIRKLEEQWTTAFQNKDVDKIMCIYNHDAIAMSSDKPICNSIESIRESYIAQFADTNILVSTCFLRVENVEVSASGDLGYSKSTETLSINKLEGIIENTINRVNVWKKINGEWKCLINIWNNDPSENR